MNPESEYLNTLYNKIMECNPLLITARYGSKYRREYYSYGNVKICVTKGKIDCQIYTITMTKIPLTIV